MSDLLKLTKLTLKRNFRDKNTLMMMLLLPIVLIFILGSALNANFMPGKLDTTHIGVIMEDKGKAGEAFREYLKIDEIQKLVTVTEFDSMAAARKDLEKGKIVSVIVVPSDFSSTMEKGQPAKLQVFDSSYSVFRKTVVHNIAEAFASGSNTYKALMKMGNPVTANQASNQVGNLPELKRYELIEPTSIKLSGNKPRAIDYYAVTMMVMTIMYGAYYGSSAIRGNKTLKIEARLKASPVSAHALLGGIMLGTLLTVFLQAVILITFSKLAYQADWGQQIPFILAVCFAETLFSVAVGVLVGVSFKNGAAAGTFISVYVMLSTFLSGGYVPIQVQGPFLETLMSLFPNYHAQKAIFGAIYEGITPDTLMHLGLLAGAAIILFIISGFLGRRTTA